MAAAVPKSRLRLSASNQLYPHIFIIFHSNDMRGEILAADIPGTLHFGSVLTFSTPVELQPVKPCNVGGHSGTLSPNGLSAVRSGTRQ